MCRKAKRRYSIYPPFEEKKEITASLDDLYIVLHELQGFVRRGEIVRVKCGNRMTYRYAKGCNQGLKSNTAIVSYNNHLRLDINEGSLVEVSTVSCLEKFLVAPWFLLNQNNWPAVIISLIVSTVIGFISIILH